MENKLDKLLTASKEMLEDIRISDQAVHARNHHIPMRPRIIHEWEQIIKEAEEDLDNMWYYAKKEV